MVGGVLTLRLDKGWEAMSYGRMSDPVLQEHGRRAVSSRAQVKVEFAASSIV